MSLMCAMGVQMCNFMVAVCNQRGIRCSIAWIGMLFVGCDDEASKDSLSNGLRRLQAHMEMMKTVLIRLRKLRLRGLNECLYLVKVISALWSKV